MDDFQLLCDLPLDELVSSCPLLGKRYSLEDPLEQGSPLTTTNSIASDPDAHQTPYFLEVYRKKGLNSRYDELRSCVLFSEKHKIGKYRKFVAKGCASPIDYLQVLLTTDAKEPCLALSLSDHQNQKSGQSSLLVTVEEGCTKFFLFPINRSEEATKVEHSLLIEFCSYSRGVLCAHQFTGLYSAAHKHESSKTQKQFYLTNDSVAIQTPLGLPDVLHRSLTDSLLGNRSSATEMPTSPTNPGSFS